MAQTTRATKKVRGNVSREALIHGHAGFVAWHFEETTNTRTIAANHEATRAFVRQWLSLKAKEKNNL